MRLKRKHNASLVVLLLPCLTSSLAAGSRAKPGSVQQLAEGASDSYHAVDSVGAGAGSPASKADVGTKDAPVDGLDGKPHAGPFVESSKKKPAVVEDIEGVESGSKEAKEKVLKDTWTIPEPDGVMDDISDRAAVKGPTGTEGGVSQKDKERLGKPLEEKVPDPPKEPPQIPGSDASDHSAGKAAVPEKKKGAVGLQVRQTQYAY